MAWLLDRCVGPLLIFTAGFAFITVSLGWIRRSALVFGFRAQRQFVSALQDPNAFWGFVIAWMSIGVLLVVFSLYLATRLLRVADTDLPRWPLRRSGLVVVASVSFVIIISLIINLLRQ